MMKYSFVNMIWNVVDKAIWIPQLKKENSCLIQKLNFNEYWKREDCNSINRAI